MQLCGILNFRNLYRPYRTQAFIHFGGDRVFPAAFEVHRVRSRFMGNARGDCQTIPMPILMAKANGQIVPPEPELAVNLRAGKGHGVPIIRPGQIAGVEQRAFGIHVPPDVFLAAKDDVAVGMGHHVRAFLDKPVGFG